MLQWRYSLPGPATDLRLPAWCLLQAFETYGSFQDVVILRLVLGCSFLVALKLTCDRGLCVPLLFNPVIFHFPACCVRQYQHHPLQPRGCQIRLTSPTARAVEARWTALQTGPAAEQLSVMGTMPSSPRSAASTTLTSLTVEMLCAVADGVDARDLLSFRLVCREMSAASYERFVATFIAKRSHLYSQYGLQALVDLSASSELAKRVKEVRIVARSLKEFREVSQCDVLAPLDEWSDRAAVP